MGKRLYGIVDSICVLYWCIRNKGLVSHKSSHEVHTKYTIKYTENGGTRQHRSTAEVKEQTKQRVEGWAGGWRGGRRVASRREGGEEERETGVVWLVLMSTEGGSTECYI
jgi:hypothetical protein